MSALSEHVDRLEAYFAGIHTCDMDEPVAVALLHVIDAAKKCAKGDGVKMSRLTLDDLTIQNRDERGNLIGGFRYATLDDLREVLEELGAEIRHTLKEPYAHRVPVATSGRYLVWRLPEEEQ